MSAALKSPAPTLTLANPPADGGSDAPAASRLGRVWAWCRRRWLLCLVIVSLAVHSIGLTAVVIRSSKPAPEPLSPEARIGEFVFQSGTVAAGGVNGAKFQLHIGLLHPDDKALRTKLDATQFRLRQAVEEVLRQAQPTDFEDTSLGELKRQLQQRIDETLATRAVSEVIVTELAIDRATAANSETP